MITICQLLESVDLDFEPRCVTKDEINGVSIWDYKPNREWGYVKEIIAQAAVHRSPVRLVKTKNVFGYHFSVYELCNTTAEQKD